MPLVRAVRRLLREDLARGASVNMLFMVMNGALGIFAGIVAARTLGPGGVGVLSIGFLLAEFASIVDNLPTVGFVREYSHDPDPRKVATVLAVKGALGMTVTAALLVLAQPISILFDVPVSVPLVFAFIPTTSIVSSVAQMAYEARRDMARRNGPMTVESVTRVGLYALVAVSPWLPVPPLEAIALATLAGSFTGTLAGLYFIPTRNWRAYDARLAREYVSFGARTQASGALNKIIFWFDIMLIDLVLGHELQGLYRTAFTMMSYLALAAGTVSIMVFPSIAQAHAAGRREEVRRTLSLGFYYGVGITLPLALVLFTFPRFILGSLFGPEFLDAAWMLRGLALLGVGAAAILPFEAFLPAVNRPDLTLRLSVLMVVVNTVLNLALVPRIGVAGAIVATGATFGAGIALGAYYVRSLGYSLPRWRDVADVLRGRAGAAAPPP